MQSWDDAIKHQQAAHIQRSITRLTEMEELLQSIEQAPFEVKLLRELAKHFHQLAGSAGIMDNSNFFTLAQTGEQQFKNRLQLPPQEIPKIRQLIEEMKTVLKSVKTPGFSTPPTEQGVFGGLAHEIIGISRSQPEILTIGLDKLAFDQLGGIVTKLGMLLKAATTTAAARDCINTGLPNALLIAMPLTDGDGYDLIEFLRCRPGGDKPVAMVLNRDGGFIDNVNAIRAGADAFVDHPKDMNEVVERLSYLMARDKPENYRILSVEDDPDWSDFVCMTLETAGYNVLPLSDAGLFEQTLLAYDPQLVLFDVNLGDFSGYDLARYMRQKERFATVPIVFLTTRSELEDHLESARAGGDDHLIKPVAPPLLVATIAGCLERYRMLQRLISRDGLTQCLTYGAFMDEAKKRIASPAAARALILFDVDHIWKINEQLGFAAGDKLIQAFSTLLRKTLRPSEVIGRLGGGKFAVLVETQNPTQLNAVVTVATYVIEQCRGMEISFSNNFVRTTASAGVAVYAQGMDLRKWLELAEQSLKSAKAGGGNRLGGWS